MLHLAWVLIFYLRPLTKQLGGRRVLRPTESQITSTYQNVWWCDGSVQHAGTVLFLPKEPYLGTTFQTTFSEISGLAGVYNAPTQAYVYVGSTVTYTPYTMSCTSNCGSYGSPGATFQYPMQLSPGTKYNYFFVFSALVYPSNQQSSWGDPVGPATYSITCSASCASSALMNQDSSNQDNDPD